MNKVTRENWSELVSPKILTQALFENLKYLFLSSLYSFKIDTKIFPFVSITPPTSPREVYSIKAPMLILGFTNPKIYITLATLGAVGKMDRIDILFSTRICRLLPFVKISVRFQKLGEVK